jgi:importin-5
MSEIQAIQAVLGADNDKRKEAEQYLETQKETNPGPFIQNLFEIMKNPDPLIAQFACVYIKRAFVGTETSNLPRESFEHMKNSLFEYVDFNKQGAYLQSLGFLIVKVYAKLEQFVELMAKTVELGQSQEPLARSFAMYLIEVLADVHMPVALFKQYVADFANIFSSGLSDADIRVKVSTLKAASAFLTSIEDKADVKEFAPIIEPMMNAIIEALNHDEAIGRKAMESIIILSEYHPILFEAYCGKLVSICSQIMENKELENGTRSQAEELVCVLATMYPALMRKSDEVRTQFVPAMFRCLTEVELPEDDEQEEWLNRVEEDEQSKSDIYTVTKINVARFAQAVNEKTILACSNEIIKDAITNPDWRVRVAGYSFLGFLAEACKEAFKTNLDEIMRMAASGVVDTHPRVQYAGIACLGLNLAEQSPTA